MTIDWIKFIPALVLLLTPGDVFNGGDKVRYRDVTRDWEGYWPRAFLHGMHSIDLVRAALGTWWLLDSLQSLPDARGFARYEVLVVQGAIRIFAVFLQTVVCREKDAVNAPFTFVIGMLIAGAAPMVSLFAIIFALTVAFGARSPIAFFPVVALAQLGIGFWFNGRGAVVNLSFAACAAMVPFLWAIMFRRDLVVAYRAKRQSLEGSRSPLR